MSAASNYLENALINHVLRNTSLTSPTTVYIALFTSDPTDADSGTEVTGGSYARQIATFSAAASGATANNTDIEFTNMPGAVVTHFGIYDALTVGNLLIHGEFTTPKTTNLGDTLQILTGDLDISLD